MKPAWVTGARTGTLRKFESLRIFACEGLICIIDERPHRQDSAYTVITPSDLEERIQALSKTYRNKTTAMMDKHERDLHKSRLAGLQNCMECIKEARYMGDPSDPEVQAYWARHRRQSTVKISFSPGCDPAGYPELPSLPKGMNTGKTVLPDGVLSTGDTVPHIHVPPRKNNRNGLILLD